MEQQFIPVQVDAIVANLYNRPISDIVGEFRRIDAWLDEEVTTDQFNQFQADRAAQHMWDIHHTLVSYN